MKRLALLILIFFSLCAAVSAQNEEIVLPEDEIIITEEKISVPENKTTAPEDITAVPENTTTVPKSRPAIPEDATAVLEPQSAVPEPQSAVPEPVEGLEEIEGIESQPEAHPPTQELQKNPLTLPLAERDEIERFRKQYLDPKWTQVLYNALENAIDYRLYVRKALEEAGLPPELEYLPIVESNYKTNAKSKSGALGLWQFMANSVKPFLTLNDYVDERLDPWKETDAALKKLKENHDLFGDWLIAIGAYNCGAGAMSRALAKADKKDFWYLCDKNLIPSQTQLYVPKLLAIADLATNSEYFGIDIPLHQEEYEVLYNERNAVFDYVTVDKAYSINTLAQNMRIDQDELKRLNPSFILGFTHPSTTSTIRLPAGTELLARSTLETMEPIDFPIKYTVVKGDSLWSISRRYGCTVSQICELNGIQENALLKIGKILYIPSK
ncbi:MAG: transglycosylase SLT domain-containing protein [Treponema sp.]|nr:transglycosylase SLT domain-containing protein [Treponema sp.]